MFHQSVPARNTRLLFRSYHVITLSNLPHVCLSLLLVNIRSYKKNRVELEGRIDLMDSKPAIVAVTETWLNGTTEQILLSGYYVAGRRDRGYPGAEEVDNRDGGGIIVFVRDDIKCVALLECSKVAERMWLTIHTDHGPLLLGTWYRPPHSDTSSQSIFHWVKNMIGWSSRQSEQS